MVYCNFNYYTKTLLSYYHHYWISGYLIILQISTSTLDDYPPYGHYPFLMDIIHPKWMGKSECPFNGYEFPSVLHFLPPLSASFSLHSPVNNVIFFRIYIHLHYLDIYNLVVLCKIVLISCCITDSLFEIVYFGKLILLLRRNWYFCYSIESIAHCILASGRWNSIMLGYWFSFWFANFNFWVFFLCVVTKVV